MEITLACYGKCWYDHLPRRHCDVVWDGDSRETIRVNEIGESMEEKMNRVFPENDPDGSKAQEALKEMLGEEKTNTVKKWQIAIDPGNTHTAFVVVEVETKRIILSYHLPNEEIKQKLKELYSTYGGDDSELAIEMIASYGMPVGKSVFDTCIWIGRFFELWGKARLITRLMVKSHMCHSAKATDANIRQALMDRYGSTKEAAIGTKKMPGPMYGMGNDERAALAVALTAIETRQEYEMSKSDE